MLFLLDMSSLIHAYFHVRKEDDSDDIAERCRQRMEKMRNLFLQTYPTMRFVAVFDNPFRKSFRSLMYRGYKEGRTVHEDFPEIEASVLESVKMDADWTELVAPSLAESDDLLASLAFQYGGKVIIHSEDSDMHSCLEKGRVCIIKKSNTPVKFGGMVIKYFSADCDHDRDENGKCKDENCNTMFKRYGFSADRWIDFQIMKGGKDNVPGWDGVGNTMAAKIIMSEKNIGEIDVNDPDLKLNKTQRASYGAFKMRLDWIRSLQALRRDIEWPHQLTSEGIHPEVVPF
jgi:5'-3' exonuclease